MSGRPNKRSDPGTSETGWMILIALILGLAVLAGPAYAGWRLGGRTWSTVAVVVAVALYLMLAALIVVIVVVVLKYRRGRVWTDSLARSMSSARDVAEMTATAVAADTARLGSQEAGVGVPLGKGVASRQWLYGTYEWCQLWIMGPRAGKSRSVAIPQIVTHGGPVVTTSNKRDVHDRTRGPRSERGTVWVNDPQEIAKQDPMWWWDPITFVTTVERSERLVEVWAAARGTGEMAGADPYFEPEGRKLAANLLVAARLGGQSVTRVGDWLTGRGPEPGVPDPVQFLERGGMGAMANEIRNFLALDQGQRDGVYGTARSYFGFLRDPRYVAWMAPIGADDRRRVFDPAAFVRSSDTLYLLSKEGAGSARALTAALTVAAYTAAEDYAEASGDRVPTPVLFVLDEAANVCRWPELPSLYSHAGSKGIILVTILQSRVQGENVWGKDGLAMMWSAANVAVAGRGINDDEHLRALATLVGTRQVRERSRSIGSKGHRSTNEQNRDEQILTEADLRAMPRGRAVLFVPGARSILLELRDFATYDWSTLVQASQDAFGPGGHATGTAATAQLSPLGPDVRPVPAGAGGRTAVQPLPVDEQGNTTLRRGR